MRPDGNYLISHGCMTGIKGPQATARAKALRVGLRVQLTYNHPTGCSSQAFNLIRRGVELLLKDPIRTSSRGVELLLKDLIRTSSRSVELLLKDLIRTSSRGVELLLKETHTRTHMRAHPHTNALRDLSQWQWCLSQSH